jgi:ABC-type polysaccharide/polyol phosphate transport system ATPase subunit
MARVVLKDVHVDFPIYGTQQLSLRHALYKRATGGAIDRGTANDRVVVRALNGISLELKQGDRLGLIGHNGSGKSTLLKAIAGIYEPVSGSLMIEGRVTPLFDMMPGLDVEDTGYENLFTSGLLLGMSREYIESKIPEIEEFSELGEYLSLPVRTYSAGMTTRLGFALVTALDPDVLLMDEGFGAADLRFAERSAERMGEFIGRSRIMVIASHSDTMIESICNKVAWLTEGRIVEIGPVEQIFEKYHASVQRDRVQRITVAEPPKVEKAAPERTSVYDEHSIRKLGLEDRRVRGTGEVVFSRLVAKDSGGSTRWRYKHGETVEFHIEYDVVVPVSEVTLILRLSVFKETGDDRIEQIVSTIKEVISTSRVEGGKSGAVVLSVSNLPFGSGSLSIYGWLGPRDESLCYDIVDQNIDLPQLAMVCEKGSANDAGLIPLSYVVSKIDASAVSAASEPAFK